MRIFFALTILSYSWSAFSSEDFSNPVPGNHNQANYYFVPLLSSCTTLVLGATALLPSLLMDMSSKTLSLNPFGILSLEMRTISWFVFGPAYSLWQASSQVLRCVGNSFISLEIGAPIVALSAYDNFVGWKRLFSNALQITRNGPSTWDYFANYSPWLGYAFVSGALYGMVIRKMLRSKHRS